MRRHAAACKLKEKLKPSQGGEPMAKDVVCGMECDPKSAVAKSVYKGQTYYFCATGCKAAFDKNPERYLKAETAAGEHAGYEHKH